MAVTKNDMIGSLKDAAFAAHNAYLTAASIDLMAAKPLWVGSINVTNTYLTALEKELAGDDADIKAAQDALNAQTQKINTALTDLENVAAAIAIVGQLLTTIASVAKFFA